MLRLDSLADEVGQHENGDYTAQALLEVARERSVQRGRWGDRHDDTHSRADWNVILSAYTGYVHDSVLEMGRVTPSEEAKLRALDDFPLTLTLRAQLLKVAATAVAWVEAIDRREDRNA